MMVKQGIMFSGYKFVLRILLLVASIVVLWLLFKKITEITSCETIPILDEANEIPLVFIGGHPRSGTTLMRVLLDVHPKIRCGPETSLIPKMLRLLNDTTYGFMKTQLKAAKLYPDAVNGAFAAFIKTLIILAGDDAPVLCNKDPLALSFIRNLRRLFPTAKFVNMVRDGRAVAASMIKRNIKMEPMNLTTEEQFKLWEKIVTRINYQCMEAGPAICLTVRYEDVVLQPNKTMHQVLEFIGVPWDPVVLRHESSLDIQVTLSQLEPSTSQVKHPIHLEALSSWAKPGSVLPESFIKSIHLTSPLLKELGYANLGIPPNYGKPEPEVLKRTELMKQNDSFRHAYA